MKSVLLSIKPSYCELIASGKKTVEVRKTRPKIKTPFKCYIYCTKDMPILGRCLKDNSLKVTDEIDFDNYNKNTLFRANGKVIGEFVCDVIYAISKYSIEGAIINNRVDSYNGLQIIKDSCLDINDIIAYTKGKTDVYLWHISYLVIYDKPKDISEFKKYYRKCYYDDLGLATPKCSDCKDCNLKRPPQSYCYVEELI